MQISFNSGSTNKVIHKCFWDMLTSAKYLESAKTNRCGVIPYTIANGSIYFLLARDKSTKELGDFGGGVRKSEFALTAALREFYEESHGIFGQIYKSESDMSNKVALVDGNNMAIIFAPLESAWLEDAQRVFLENPPKKKKEDEVSELVWVSEYNFSSLIKGESVSRNILWSKIQSFFRKNYNHQRAKNLLKSAASRSPGIIAV